MGLLGVQIYCCLVFFDAKTFPIETTRSPYGLEDKELASSWVQRETHTAVPRMSLAAQPVYQVDHGRPPLAHGEAPTTTKLTKKKWTRKGYVFVEK